MKEPGFDGCEQAQIKRVIRNLKAFNQDDGVMVSHTVGLNKRLYFRFIVRASFFYLTL